MNRTWTSWMEGRDTDPSLPFYRKKDAGYGVEPRADDGIRLTSMFPDPAAHMYAADKLTSLCVLSPYETSFELLDAVNTYDRPFEEWKAGEIVLSAPQGVVARPSRKGVTDTFVEDEFVVRFDQSSGTFDSFSKSGIRRTGEYEVADDAIGHVPFCDSSALSIENPPPGNFSVTVSVRRKPRMDLGAIVAGFNPSPSFRWKNAFLEATWNEGTTPDKVCMLALNRLGWRYET